jgi:hypothetical protein
VQNQNVERYNEDKEIISRWVSKCKMSGLRVSIEYTNKPEDYDKKSWKLTSYTSIDESLTKITLPKLKYGAISLTQRYVNKELLRGKSLSIVDLTNQPYEKINFSNDSNELIDEIQLVQSLYIQSVSNPRLILLLNIESFKQLVASKLTSDMCISRKFRLVYEWMELRYYHDLFNAICEYSMYYDVDKNTKQKQYQPRTARDEISEDSEVEVYDNLDEPANGIMDLFSDIDNEVSNIDKQLTSKCLATMNKCISNMFNTTKDEIMTHNDEIEARLDVSIDSKILKKLKHNFKEMHNILEEIYNEYTE